MYSAAFKLMVSHDDVIKWKHFPRNRPFVRGIHRSPVNSPHTGQWSRALMFSLICVWINDWVNNREAGWFETLSRPFWRHRNVNAVMVDLASLPGVEVEMIHENLATQFLHRHCRINNPSSRHGYNYCNHLALRNFLENDYLNQIEIL